MVHDRQVNIAIKAYGRFTSLFLKQCYMLGVLHLKQSLGRKTYKKTYFPNVFENIRNVKNIKIFLSELKKPFIINTIIFKI